MKTRKSRDGNTALRIGSFSDGRKRHTLYFDKSSDKAQFCSCPDYIFRQRAKHGRCKHMIEMPTLGIAAQKLMAQVGGR